MLLAELLHATAGVDDALNAGGEQVAHLEQTSTFRFSLVEPVSTLAACASHLSDVVAGWILSFNLFTSEGQIRFDQLPV